MSVAAWIGRTLLVGLALLAAAVPVQAQTLLVLPTTPGPSGSGLVSTTVSGWTVSIYSCVQINQGALPGNDCAGSEVAISVSGNTLSLVFQNVNTANPLLTASANASTYSDLSYTMTVQAPGTQNIWYASTTLAGSVKAGDSADLSLLSTGISTYAGLTTNLSNSPVMKAVVISPTNATGALSQDTKDNSTSPPAIAGDNVMNIATVTDTFKVPEPLSLGLFGVGLAGLAAARRQRRGMAPQNATT